MRPKFRVLDGLGGLWQFLLNLVGATKGTPGAPAAAPPGFRGLEPLEPRLLFSAAHPTISAVAVDAAARAIDVTFAGADGLAVDASTVTDSAHEFTLRGDGVGTVALGSGAPTAQGDGTYRYTFVGAFEPGDVELVFAAGAWADDDGNASLAEYGSFVVAANPDGDAAGTGGAYTTDPAPLVATSQDELQRLLRERDGDLVIYIDGMLTIRPPDEGGWPAWDTSVLDVWHRDQDLTLQGLTADSGFQYAEVFDGQYPISPVTLLRLRRHNVALRDLTFQDFQWKGGPVRVEGCEHVLVQNCRFRRIGSIPYEYGRYGDDIQGGSDDPNLIVTYGCVGGSAANLEVHGCLFEDCVANASAWAHCLYFHGEGTARVEENRFLRCGNPLALDYGALQVENNVFGDFALCRTPDGGMDYPGFCFPGRSQVTIRGNVLRGTIRSWGAGPSDVVGVIDNNDLAALHYTKGFWFSRWGQGTLRWSDWQAQGHDVHSAAPWGPGQQAPIAGDCNLDGIVDELDMDVLGAHWGTEAGWTQGDLNGDGVVDLNDLGILAGHWGQRAASEPAAAPAAAPKGTAQSAEPAAAEPLAVEPAVAGPQPAEGAQTQPAPRAEPLLAAPLEDALAETEPLETDVAAPDDAAPAPVEAAPQAEPTAQVPKAAGAQDALAEAEPLEIDPGAASEPIAPLAARGGRFAIERPAARQAGSAAWGPSEDALALAAPLHIQLQRPAGAAGEADAQRSGEPGDALTTSSGPVSVEANAGSGVQPGAVAADLTAGEATEDALAAAQPLDIDVRRTMGSRALDTGTWGPREDLRSDAVHGAGDADPLSQDALARLPVA